MSKNSELIDLVDEHGLIQKTGVFRDKLNIYPDLHMQIVIGVIQNSKGEILVEKRSLTKKSEPGKVDHVCGVVKSGETPEEAIVRECMEETGIRPKNLTIINKGVNIYGRYKYLFVGFAENDQKIKCSDESEWVKFVSNQELKAKRSSRELIFVDDFFENNDFALMHI